MPGQNMSWSVFVTSTSVDVSVVRSVIAMRVKLPLESPNMIGEYEDHVSICVGTVQSSARHCLSKNVKNGVDGDECKA